MSGWYEFELGKAADILVRELFKLRTGETIVITADTESDARVVEATARAAFSAGAKPMVIWLASPLGVGKAADPMLPQDALVGALKGTDAWVEFNNKWLLYSTTYDIVMEENKRLRYLCLVGMNADMMVRCIGRIDYPTLAEFITILSDMTVKAKELPLRGFPDKPGSHMMAGQIGWRIVRESVNGRIVFDGSLVPPIGLLKEPVILHVEDGRIVEIEGGGEAKAYETWLKSFGHPNMLRVAHICYGFNPGAKLTGDIVEDERVWGCTEWGVGNHPGMLAPSHSDGICLNSSVWMDGVQVLDEGKLTHPKLAELAKKLGKQ
jgi:leucyl aminopeptidase (aminopeptidase T)